MGTKPPGLPGYRMPSWVLFLLLFLEGGLKKIKGGGRYNWLALLSPFSCFELNSHCDKLAVHVTDGQQKGQRVMALSWDWQGVQFIEEFKLRSGIPSG